MLGHSGQLKPVLQATDDAIADIDAGFIGKQGEWPDPSNGLVNATGGGDNPRALLGPGPVERMVVPRYPRFNQTNARALAEISQTPASLPSPTAMKTTPRVLHFRTGWLVLALLLCAAASFGQATNVQFTFDKAYTTSAGVYKADGTLVRTLWRKVAYAAGSHTAVWDGKDDAGQALAAGAYEVKLIRHNVNYVWEGVIGNTSAAQVGGNVHKSLQSIQSMAFEGPDAFFAVGYNEGQSCMHRFDPASPQVRNSIPRIDPFTRFDHVATDGNLVYWANNGGINPAKMFITATRASDNAFHTFSGGQDLCLNYGPNSTTNCYPDQTWNGVADVVTTTESFGLTTGLAVQKVGSYLLVAHGNLNEIHVLNKTTGTLVRTVAVTNPRQLARTATDGVGLISTVGGADVVQRYRINADGARVHQWTYVGGLNQQRKLEAVSLASADPALTAPATPGGQQPAGLVAYPNPSPDGRATLHLQARAAQRATVLVRDGRGRVVCRLTVPLPAGPSDLPLPGVLVIGTNFVQTTLDGQLRRFTLRVD